MPSQNSAWDKVLIIGMNVVQTPAADNKSIGRSVYNVGELFHRSLEMEAYSLAQKFPRGSVELVILNFHNGPITPDMGSLSKRKNLWELTDLSSTDTSLTDIPLPDEMHRQLEASVEGASRVKLYLMSSLLPGKLLSNAIDGTALAGFVNKLGILRSPSINQVEINLESCSAGFYLKGQIPKDFRKALEFSPKFNPGNHVDGDENAPYLEVRYPFYVTAVQQLTGHKLYSLDRSGGTAMMLLAEMNESQQGYYKVKLRAPFGPDVADIEFRRELQSTLRVDENDLMMVPKSALVVWRKKFVGEVVACREGECFVVRLDDENEPLRHNGKISVARMPADAFEEGGGVGQRFSVASFAERGKTVALLNEPILRDASIAPGTHAISEQLRPQETLAQKLAKQVKLQDEELLDVVDVKDERFIATINIKKEHPASFAGYVAHADAEHVYLCQVLPVTRPEKRIVRLARSEYPMFEQNRMGEPLYGELFRMTRLTQTKNADIRFERVKLWQTLGGFMQAWDMYSWQIEHQVNDKALLMRLPIALEDQRQLLSHHLDKIKQWRRELNNVTDPNERNALQVKLDTSLASTQKHLDALSTSSIDKPTLEVIETHLHNLSRINPNYPYDGSAPAINAILNGEALDAALKRVELTIDENAVWKAKKHLLADRLKHIKLYLQDQKQRLSGWLPLLTLLSATNQNAKDLVKELRGQVTKIETEIKRIQDRQLTDAELLKIDTYVQALSKIDYSHRVTHIQQEIKQQKPIGDATLNWALKMGQQTPSKQFDLPQVPPPTASLATAPAMPPLVPAAPNQPAVLSPANRRQQLWRQFTRLMRNFSAIAYQAHLHYSGRHEAVFRALQDAKHLQPYRNDKAQHIYKPVVVPGVSNGKAENSFSLLDKASESTQDRTIPLLIDLLKEGAFLTCMRLRDYNPDHPLLNQVDNNKELLIVVNAEKQVKGSENVVAVASKKINDMPLSKEQLLVATKKHNRLSLSPVPEKGRTSSEFADKYTEKETQSKPGKKHR